MRISELIEELQAAQTEHGDLSVHIQRWSYQSSHLPPGAMGGGGGGHGWEWCGTVKRVQRSEKYPDQLDLITTA